MIRRKALERAIWRDLRPEKVFLGPYLIIDIQDHLWENATLFMIRNKSHRGIGGI
jgi:hypothetical protein